jgi:hypothetical protein
MAKAHRLGRVQDHRDRFGLKLPASAEKPPSGGFSLAFIGAGNLQALPAQ